MSSSILSLPTELHLTIFQALQDKSAPQSEQDDLRAVSQVCSSWRNLALSTSTFWTSIFISEASADLTVRFDDRQPIDEACASQVFPWVATLFQRSGTKAIDIDISLHSPRFHADLSDDQNQANFSWSREHAILLSHILAANATRLRTVEIRSHLWQLLKDLGTALVGVPMPLLQEWNVIRDHPRWGYAQADPDITGTMAALEYPTDIIDSRDRGVDMYPRLRTLRLYASFQDWGRLIPRNLVELDLEYVPMDSRPSYANIRTLLLGSQFTLKSLTLWAAAPAPAGTGEKITLPNLHSLSVGISFTETALFLTHYLDVPNLRNLEIFDMIYQNPRNFADGRTVLASTWALIDFYIYMIRYWPIGQITDLTLRSASFPLSVPDFGDYEELEAAFAQKRSNVSLPILITFLLHCSSLKNLHLVNPDISVFKALVSPFWVKDMPNAVLPCLSLDRLHIETKSLMELVYFFQQNSCCLMTEAITSRQVDTILLRVPPDWGAVLGPYLTGNTATRVLNSKLGYFEVRQLDSRRSDVPFALPVFSSRRRVINLLGK